MELLGNQAEGSILLLLRQPESVQREVCGRLMAEDGRLRSF